jgi:hypothetical protein
MVSLFLERPEISLADFSPDAFIDACANGSTTIVRSLLGREDFSIESDHINRALVFAIESGHFETVKTLLLDGRADPTWHYFTALVKAISNSDLKMAKLLLADPRVDYKEIQSTIDAKILRSDNSVCHMIRLYGLQIDAAKRGLPLNIQSFNPDYFDVILYSACWAGKTATFSQLIHMKKKVGPIFSVESENNLALELAIHSGQTKLVMLLLDEETVKSSFSLIQLEEILANVKDVQRNPLFTSLFDWIITKDESLQSLKAIRMELGKSGVKKGKYVKAVRAYQKKGLPNIARLISAVGQPVYA